MRRAAIGVGLGLALVAGAVAVLALWYWPRQFDQAWRAGDYERGDAIADRLALLGLDTVDQRMILATGFLITQRPDDSEAQLLRVLEIEPSVQTWDHLGMLRERRGDARGLIAAYEGSLDVGGSELLPTRAARAWLELGERERALALLDEASRTRPDSHVLHGAMAVLATELGDPARAVAFYERVAELQPDWAHIPNNIAWLLATEEAVRDPERALELARRAVAAEPDEANYLETLAVALDATGQREEALATARRAAALAAGGPDEALRARLEAWLASEAAGAAEETP